MSKPFNDLRTQVETLSSQVAELHRLHYSAMARRQDRNLADITARRGRRRVWVTIPLGVTYSSTEQTKLAGIAASAIANVSEDTSPTLGGDLDCNGNDVTGAGAISGSTIQTTTTETYTLTNVSTTRTFDPTTVTLEDLGHVVGTLLVDLDAGKIPTTA